MSNGLHSYVKDITLPPGSGITSVAGQTWPAITLSTNDTGSDFAINPGTPGANNIEFNLPEASAVNTGKLTATDWKTFNAKVAGPISSIDGEIALFDGVTGKVIKRATGTGVVKATAGVYGTGNVDLTSEVTGILPVPNGGTGVNTIPANAVIIGNGVSPITTVAPGTSGNVLTSDGTNWTSVAATAGEDTLYRHFMFTM